MGDRYEVIYAGPRPHPSRDSRAGALEATVHVEDDGTLRLEEAPDA
jgi:hypothetical protein